MVRQHPQDDAKQTSESLQHRLTVKFSNAEVAQQLQKRSTESSAGMAMAGEHVMELEFEEWDGSTPFYQHCLAGSLAGVAEHLLMYPFDTLKTQIQSYCADCPSAAAAENTAEVQAGTMMGAWRQHQAGGMSRLWRGAQAMAVGCIPAHAMYFSSYEMIKAFFLQRQPEGSHNMGALGSTVAGSTAALCHDSVMVPADTVKQRLQLGYYQGLSDAVRTMIRVEGVYGLYRSLPVTLCTNLPYGAVMVTTNEYLREYLMQANNQRLDVKTTLLAGCGAGMVAAAVTTPLDRLKTRLQTQGLSMVINCDKVAGGDPCPNLATTPKYNGLKDAFQSIVREEGMVGLFRGLFPRLMTHTPSVAISWTVYEAMKLWLQ